MDSGSSHQTTATPDPTAKKGKAGPDLTGQTLGDYQILRCLGQGGMGQVYLAEQVSLKRKVALKVLRADLAANETALARFIAEAEVVARATHANIVQIYAIGEFNGMHYMALEYVEGRNLRQYLEKKGPPELMMSLSIIRQVASAIQRASELGIIHRDIKPENILLTRKGEVKVADFGLSRIFGDNQQPLNLTQSGVTMGTPLYMSPEQVEGKAVDPRTDIYSFGVSCYELLTGRPPFRGDTAFEVAVQHVQKQPVPVAQIRPDLPADLCTLVHRMMAKNPADRIQTGREIIREVMRLRDALVTGAVSPGGSGVLPAGPASAGVGSGGQPSYIIQVGQEGLSNTFDATATQRIARPSNHYWAWLAGASVLAALGAGLGYGWWRSLDQATVQQQQPPVVQPGEQDSSVKPVAGQNKEEQWLLEQIKKHETSMPVKSMEYRIDLGVLYLKGWKLEQAADEFKAVEDAADKLTGRPQDKFQLEQEKKRFRSQAVLGNAVVLAFKDMPKESNKLFRDVFKQDKGPKGQPAVHPVLQQIPPALAELVARALDHNFANSPTTFPQSLLVYRSPPAAKVKSGS